MKRISAVLTALFMIVSCFVLPSDVSAYDTVSVYLDGRQLYFDVAPCIINGRTMVPVRTVLEAAGAVVSWDPSMRMTAASRNGIIVWISDTGTVMSVQKNGITYQVNFDVQPYIINGRTLVPIKPIAEAFNMGLVWNAQSRCVMLTSYGIPESIEIQGFVPPVNTTVGMAYTISGIVSSNSVLDRLNVKVTDVATGQVQINETQFNINSPSYSISDIDSRVKFGILSAGSKLLQITAVTKNETRQTFAYNFNVNVPVRPQSAQISGNSSMLWPVPSSGLITTIFWCDNPYCHSNAGRVNGHAALDIAAAENAAVVAVKDGTVLKTGFGDSQNGFNGYGNFILVDHGNGLTTQYSHLYSIYVSPGDYVYAGQTIGGVGNTGNSTGNHLDFNIEQNGRRCDPLYYLDMHPNVKCYEPCDLPYFEEALRSRGLR